MRAWIIFTALIALPALAFADTINVPADYPTIQAGIDAAVNGDTVLVAPGTYVESIDFVGKAITVRSEQGAAVTTIDANRAENVVIFQNGEDLGSILEGFTITNSYSLGTAGAITCLNSSSPILTMNDITDNLSDRGTGIYCNNSSPHIADNHIYANITLSYGGGIFVHNESSPHIVNNTISNNIGTGIMLDWGSDGVIEHNYISGNTANSIYCYGSGDPTISFNTLSGDSLTKNGIKTGGCSPNIVGNMITNHTDVGILLDQYTSPTILKNVIKDNKYGIGCYNDCSPVIDSNYIFDNTNGAFYCDECYAAPRLLIANNIFYGNNGNNGGAIGVWRSNVDIVNNTIVGNTANNGGGIFSCTGTLYISNNILWDNHCLNEGPGIYMQTSSSVSVSYSDIQGGQASIYVKPGGGNLIWGSGNIDAEPLFADATNNDHHLTWNSPCRDTGDSSTVTEPTDFEGDPRIALEIVDMGADEFYTHLYITGNQTPGGSIQGKLVGLPGTSPVYIIIGFDVFDPPKATIYGDLYLKTPRILIPLFPMPGNGIIAIPTTVPLTPPAPYDVPMQGLIGLNSDSLTNLCVLEVR